MEREESKKMLQKGHHRLQLFALPDLKTQLQKHLPGIKATNKCSCASKKVNRLQLTLTECSQKIFSPVVWCSHGALCNDIMQWCYSVLLFWCKCFVWEGNTNRSWHTENEGVQIYCVGWQRTSARKRTELSSSSWLRATWCRAKSWQRLQVPLNNLS